MSKWITKHPAVTFLFAIFGSLFPVAGVTLYLISGTITAGDLAWMAFAAIWILLVVFFLSHDEQPKKGSAAWCEAADRNIAREKAFITALMRETDPEFKLGEPCS